MHRSAAIQAGQRNSTTREYDELVKALGGQRTLLDKQRGLSSEPAEIYNHQSIQYCGSLTVDAPEEEIRVTYGTSSTDLWASNFDCFGQLSEHNFHLGSQ